jgi:mRNA interferase MazF
MDSADLFASPVRGELWWIEFDPTVGAEVRKTRPAVVASVPAVGVLPLRIVVPVTEWDARWSRVPWMVHLRRGKRTGLAKDSAADCFQVKCVSLERFRARLGLVTADEVDEIASAVALCVGAA